MLFSIEIKKVKKVFLLWVIKMPSKSPYSEEMICMTEKQRTEIVRMRQNGTAYNTISNLLGISVNTVKSYCRRNNIKPLDKPIPIENICLNCGKQITQREKVKNVNFVVRSVKPNGGIHTQKPSGEKQIMNCAAIRAVRILFLTVTRTENIALTNVI